MSESWSPTWPATVRPCGMRWMPAEGMWLVTRPDGSVVGGYGSLLAAEAASIKDTEQREAA